MKLYSVTFTNTKLNVKKGLEKKSAIRLIHGREKEK